MKRLLSVLLILTLVFSTTVVFAENNNTEKRAFYFDMFFEPAPEYEISLMSSDGKDLETVITEAWDELKASIDISEFAIDPDDIENLYERIFYSNPRYYYVMGFAEFSTSKKTGLVTKIYPTYATEDIAEIEQTMKEIDEVCDDVLFLISDNMSDFDKVMTVHDYMVEHFTYDWEFFEEFEAGNIDFDMYHPQFTLEIMTEKTGVCQGYALAFSYIMEKLGIDTRFVSSEEMNHAWNLVKVDGDWYHIDVTWDDTDMFGEVTHEYELLSSERILSLSRPHVGFDLGEIVADSNRFDDAPWHSSTAEVSYCHGKAYWIETAKFEDENGAEFTGSNIVDEDGNVIYENLAGSRGRWNLEGNMYVPDMVFSGLAEYNGKLYFNTDDAIYTYDPHTKLTSKLMNKMSVGGLYIDKNILVYAKTAIEDGYLILEDGGRIPLEHARFAEPFMKGDEIVARIYKECDDDIIIFARTKNGIEKRVVKEQGYSSVTFAADDEAEIFYWTSNLKPLRDKEEIIVPSSIKDNDPEVPVEPEQPAF